MGVVFLLLKKDDDDLSSSFDEGDDDDELEKHKKGRFTKTETHTLEETIKQTGPFGTPGALLYPRSVVRRTLPCLLRADTVVPTVTQCHATKSTKKRTPYQKIIKKRRKTFPGKYNDDHELRTSTRGQTGCIKLPDHRADHLGFFHRVSASLRATILCHTNEKIARKYCRSA